MHPKNQAKIAHEYLTWHKEERCDELKNKTQKKVKNPNMPHERMGIGEAVVGRQRLMTYQGGKSRKQNKRVVFPLLQETRPGLILRDIGSNEKDIT